MLFPVYSLSFPVEGDTSRDWLLLMIQRISDTPSTKRLDTKLNATLAKLDRQPQMHI